MTRGTFHGRPFSGRWAPHQGALHRARAPRRRRFWRCAWPAPRTHFGLGGAAYVVACAHDPPPRLCCPAFVAACVVRPARFGPACLAGTKDPFRSLTAGQQRPGAACVVRPAGPSCPNLVQLGRRQGPVSVLVVPPVWSSRRTLVQPALPLSGWSRFGPAWPTPRTPRRPLSRRARLQATSFEIEVVIQSLSGSLSRSIPSTGV